MSEALFAVFGAALGSVLTFFLDRSRWLRPKVSAETGNLARRSVNSARRVFAGASAHGGRLVYPWMVNGEELHEDQLADDLRQAAARVGNKQFRGYVDTIAGHLRGVYAAQPGPSIVTFIRDERPETRSERDWREASERKAAKQREHAEAGLAAVEPALALLDKLERHS